MLTETELVSNQSNLASYTDDNNFSLYLPLVGRDVSKVGQFFTDIWAPMVCRLHTPGGSVLPMLFTNLIGALDNLSIQEVRHVFFICDFVYMTSCAIALSTNEPFVLFLLGAAGR